MVRADEDVNDVVPNANVALNANVVPNADETFRTAGWPIPRLRLALLVAALALAPRAGEAQTYGYKQEVDPLVLGVKKAIGLARSKDPKGVRQVLGELQWQIDELKDDVGVDLSASLERAVASGDPTRTAYALTHLVFQALRQKFYWNTREKLEKYVPARSRLDAAQFYYEEILSHAVRRADQATEKDRHRTILKLLRDMRGTLGSPGLFGVGSQKPDVDRFTKLAGQVERLLVEVYPDFTVTSASGDRKPPR